MSSKPKADKFGNQTPFCEPAWYQGQPSPYYHDGHRAFRAKVRAFVEEEIKPHVDEWIKTGYPPELHRKFYDAGIGGIIYPKEFGGTPPADFDAFYELILVDEMARVGGGGVLGQSAINSMALPPILMAGSDRLKNMVARDVICGKKFICLAISEPGAGSDVANIQTTAVRDGDDFILNGSKKWITGGMMADYFTMAVRTGGPDSGMGGISLVLVPRHTPGLRVRKMETTFDNSHSTTFVTMDDVRVPAANLIGEENAGFFLIVTNFNHERWIIAAGAARAARLCYEEAFNWAITRETFGRKLHQHAVIRYKLAEMARQVESLQDFVERVAFAFSNGVEDWKMGGQCALLKVQASKTFEYCSREASQIFGGASIVKEGRGKLVERMAREVRASAIPGGSEEILLDFAMRQAFAKAKKIRSKL